MKVFNGAVHTLVWVQYAMPPKVQKNLILLAALNLKVCSTLIVMKTQMEKNEVTFMN